MDMQINILSSQNSFIPIAGNLKDLRLLENITNV